AVVEAAADPGAVDADHVDHAAGFRPLGGLVHQLLEDPRVAAAPGIAQADGGDGLVHARIIAQWRGRPATGRTAAHRSVRPSMAGRANRPRGSAAWAACLVPRIEADGAAGGDGGAGGFEAPALDRGNGFAVENAGRVRTHHAG